MSGRIFSGITWTNSDIPLYQPYGTSGAVPANLNVSSISTGSISIGNSIINFAGGRFISTIGNELYYWDGTELEQLTSISSISTVGEWALEPAISSINADGNDLLNANYVECAFLSTFVVDAVSSVTTLLDAKKATISSLKVYDLVAENVTVLSTINTVNYLSSSSVLANTANINLLSAGKAYLGSVSANTANINTLSTGNAFVGNLTGNTANFNSISSGNIVISGFNTSSITAFNGYIEHLSANTAVMNALQVSSINGSEFTSNAVTVSNITASQIATQGFSTISASIQQGLMSSIVFKPQFGVTAPPVNVNLGLGEGLADGLIGLGTGLLGVAVGVPLTVGTGLYGITTGIGAMINPRSVNTINNNIYEQINQTTQLQISTLGQQISTIYRFTSTVPCTISLATGTITSVDIEVFRSTISSAPPVTCIRSIADPTQLVSTPYTYNQAFGQWTELPASGGAVGSNLNLSTLTLLQSTILRSDPNPGGILQVLEAQNPNSYGQVEAQSYYMGASIGGSNGILYYRDLDDRPGFLDNSATAHILAYTTDIPGSQNLASVLATGNSAGANNINMNGNNITSTNTVFTANIRPNSNINANVDITAPGTGLANIQGADVSVVATTGTVFINSQSQYVEVENLQFSIVGAPATGTSITTANTGRNIDIITSGAGNITLSTNTGVVNIDEIQFSGTNITAPATNADITFNMNGTGSLLVNNTSAVGGADPIMTLQVSSLTGGASANPVKILMFKNDGTTTASDLIGDITCRANGATPAVPMDYTAIRSVVRGSATSGNIDGSLQLLVAENSATPSPGTLTNYIELNGGNANVRITKPIDMNVQNITNVNAIALGSLTNVGLLGYNITSRGAGNNSTWQQSRQSLLANYGGGSSIDDTTPTNFGVTLPTISFPLSATGRYKVTVSIGFDLGSSADLLIYPEVVYNAVTYPGAIYAPSLYVVAPHVNKGGVIHNSASFVDYFTVPISSTSISFTVDVKVITVTGTTTTNNVRTYITVEPDFD